MTHYGDGPAGTTRHRGDREDCSGPDCGPQRRGVTPHLVEIDEVHRLPLVSPYVVQDPSALQSHVEEIMGHPRTVREVIEADPRVKEVFGPRPARRGTTNGNARGGSEDRRKRREWLVATYRADVDVLLVFGLIFPVPYGMDGGVPACRCYRCGRLLTVDTVTVDRIVPGCQGGTYRRSNIRPACGGCNSSTGATTRRKGKRT